MFARTQTLANTFCAHFSQVDRTLARCHTTPRTTTLKTHIGVRSVSRFIYMQIHFVCSYLNKDGRARSDVPSVLFCKWQRRSPRSLAGSLSSASSHRRRTQHLPHTRGEHKRTTREKMHGWWFLTKVRVAHHERPMDGQLTGAPPKEKVRWPRDAFLCWKLGIRVRPEGICQNRVGKTESRLVSFNQTWTIFFASFHKTMLPYILTSSLYHMIKTI